VAESAREVYADAVEQAAIETGLSEAALPQRLPYTVDQIFERKLSADELPDQRPSRKKHP
jgi:hypothetical protein